MKIDNRMRSAEVRRQARAHLAELRRARFGARAHSLRIVGDVDDREMSPDFAMGLMLPALPDIPPSPEKTIIDEASGIIDEPCAAPEPEEKETPPESAVAEGFEPWSEKEAVVEAALDGACLMPATDTEPVTGTPLVEVGEETDGTDLACEHVEEKCNMAAPATGTDLAKDHPGTVAPDAETALVASSPAESTTSTIQKSDLGALPGAGPGLIWMMQSCGINSIAELANADIAELEAGLGIVGRILDVGHLITLAQRHNGVE